MEYTFSQESKRIKRSEIREILKWSRKPGVISFGGGLPDSCLFPIGQIIDITRDVLTEKGYLALQYGPTPGEAEMLDAMKMHMNMFGEEVSTEQLCITSSSQQGLDLLGMLFLDEGAPVILELPSYLGAIQVFGRVGADMIGIPQDDQGLRIDLLVKKLDELIALGKKPRFIYVIPDFQNPSGATMPLERRKELIHVCRERQIPLVEDSPYRELSFTGNILPSLWTLADGKGVILMKTFSKMLFPGMRMGWLAAEEEVIEKIVMLKQSVDLCTPSFNQLILASYIRKGYMKATIERAIECYRPKWQAMLRVLEKYMPEGVTWSKPDGGMFLWVRLPEGLDAKDVFMKAIENNVAYVTGRPFHCDNSGGNTLRLNYSFPSVQQIETGINSLGATIREFL